MSIKLEDSNILQKYETVGQNMHDLMTKLYPICRSLTGTGVRETLKILKEIIPVEIHEVSSGTKVFDWTIPKEWNIRDAYIKDSNGNKVVDFQELNLHVLIYSVAVDCKMSLEELKKHIYTLPDFPDRIPYRTSYYSENWGFCMSHKKFLKLKEDQYHVVIDSEHSDGSLTYGETVIKGKSKDEFLLSCYLCHPSLCNDNLSGVVLLTYLAKWLGEQVDLQNTYRLIFIPETIGAITWLAKNEKKVENIKYGLVATCCGDSGNLTYKRSRRGDAIIDLAVEKILQDDQKEYKLVDFFPSGSDERQFCSPGFRLPVGSLMRTMYGHFDQYHTSADDLEFVQAPFLADTFDKYTKIINLIENNSTYVNQNPKCEPQLGKRGLYEAISGLQGDRLNELAMMWVLNLSDGKHSLLDIAIRSEMSFEAIKFAADALAEKELLK